MEKLPLFIPRNRADWQEFAVFGYSGAASLVTGGGWIAAFVWYGERTWGAGKPKPSLGFGVLYIYVLTYGIGLAIGYFVFMGVHNRMAANVNNVNTITGSILGSVTGLIFAVFAGVIALVVIGAYAAIVVTYSVVGFLVLAAIGSAFRSSD